MVNQSSTKNFKVVAIDGGAASGKSSTARALAKRLHYLHVDTGSHYRAFALSALQAGVAPAPGPDLDRFIASIALDSVLSGNQARVRINGRVFDDHEIRCQAVNDTVSDFAALPAVRNAVKTYQQNQVSIAADGLFNGLVMEGRDIGTVILPGADLKVFLTADPGTRQLRRSKEGASEQIAKRDVTDSSRQVAPLRPADDAWIIDNSDVGIEGVVELLVQRLA